MRAIAVNETGDMPELMDLPVPRPAPGEIVVRLEAAPLNPLDVGIAAGHFEGRMPHVYPLVLGVDGAGRVTEVGEGLRGFEPGDLVHGQFLCAPLGRGIVGATGGVGVFAAVSAALVATPELLATERIIVVNFMMQNKPDLLARITAEVAAGRITAPIQRTITLDQVPDALASTASGVRGKTTIRI